MSYYGAANDPRTNTGDERDEDDYPTDDEMRERLESEIDELEADMFELRTELENKESSLAELKARLAALPGEGA